MWTWKTCLKHAEHAEHAWTWYLLACSSHVQHMCWCTTHVLCSTQICCDCMCCPSPVSWAACPMLAPLGPSRTGWQVWSGPTIQGASVIAAQGQGMAAVCGTPALGRWVGQSMSKVWFWQLLSMFMSCLKHELCQFISCSEHVQLYKRGLICLLQLDRSLFFKLYSHFYCVHGVLTTKRQALRSGVASIQF